MNLSWTDPLNQTYYVFILSTERIYGNPIIEIFWQSFSKKSVNRVDCYLKKNGKIFLTNFNENYSLPLEIENMCKKNIKMKAFI